MSPLIAESSGSSLISSSLYHIIQFFAKICRKIVRRIKRKYDARLKKKSTHLLVYGFLAKIYKQYRITNYIERLTTHDLSVAVPKIIFVLSLFLDYFDRCLINTFASSRTASARCLCKLFARGLITQAQQNIVSITKKSTHLLVYGFLWLRRRDLNHMTFGL